MRCIAVDWSGSKEEEGQLRGIWLAIAEETGLTRLWNGLTRAEAYDFLAQEIKSEDEVIIGLDFAFSLPEWYLKERGCGAAIDLWKLARSEKEQWLSGDVWPFWGRDKSVYQKRPPDLPEGKQFRQTDQSLRDKHSNPKSVFQIAGGGQVGTGSIRGLPMLLKLQQAGAAIWPFDAPKRATVVEIYPRVFYRKDVTNNMTVKGVKNRKEYLAQNYRNIQQHWQDIMVGNENAFDAGVSALVMAENGEQFSRLKQGAGVQLLEGEIWRPGL